MGYLGKTFDFNEDSAVSFEDGIFQLTIIGSPKYDKDQQRTLLNEAGLDYDELNTMPQAERDELIESKRLNPKDFTFEEDE